MPVRPMIPASFVFALLFGWVIPVIAGPTIVNDITQINPIVVDEIVVPKTVDEIRELVRTHRGPISVGGGHFSMGGQTASEQTLHLDMRGLNRIIGFSPETKTIIVEAGITWRAIQETIDHKYLSLKIMQSYSNFTVGGSLSVNVHGRYVGQGPLIGSVKAIKVVLADGQLVEASPTERPELFFGCIGGYGGLGIIVEATLELADNRKVERSVQAMSVKAYKDFFFNTIRPSHTAVFHNGDIYPPAYDEVLAITWSTTDKPVTVEDRLMPIQTSYWFDQLSYFWLSEIPLGKEFREYVIDPLRLRHEAVVWRNYEASYDVHQLEPRSRETSTYVLEEYFVPVQRFDEFSSKMAEIFTRYQANIMNVSIRHAVPDRGSVMAWAREEVFAFVVYYKQGTAPHEKTTVGIWTRELIDAVLSVGGTYYLPYQLHGTDEQFHRAYPRAREWFALKQQLDPDNRFRNKLWDKYYHPPVMSSAAMPLPAPSTAEPTERDVKKNFKP
ncbi:MAG: FAD-binding oxidoreductase [Nitrospira sp.]|nr:FAD-binding oxidoreductase [Nitrospira sp.]